MSRWCTKQRGLKAGTVKRGLLNEDRIRRLEEIPGWSWCINDAKWEKQYSALIAYVQKHRAFPTAGKGILGRWIQTQRSQQVTTSEDRRRRLEAIPGWVWRVTKWDHKYNALKSYVNKHGSLPQDRGSIQWCSIQRGIKKQQRLSEERVAKLEAIPEWVWDVEEASWEKQYDALRAYVTKHQEFPRSRQGQGTLATWRTKQRKNRRTGTLTQERIKQLEKIPGWRWNGRAKPSRQSQGTWDTKWKKQYDALRLYVEMHDALPPRSTGSLGSWCDTQRQFKKKQQLTKERIGKLEEIPRWQWNPKPRSTALRLKQAA